MHKNIKKSIKKAYNPKFLIWSVKNPLYRFDLYGIYVLYPVDRYSPFKNSLENSPNSARYCLLKYRLCRFFM